MNPYILLAGGVVYAASCTGAYFYGQHAEKNAVEAGQKAALVEAASEARANAEIDYSVQQELALEKQKHELLAQQKTRTVYKTVTADKGAADCRLNDQSYSVLLDSIRAANGASSPASASDGAVPASNGANGLQPSGGSDSAGRNSVDSEHLPTGPSSSR